MMPSVGPSNSCLRRHSSQNRTAPLSDFLHQRRAERGRDELAPALAELGLGDEEQAGGIDDRGEQGGDTGAPGETQDEVAARLGFQPVEQQHQGDQQRHREQGQRQRDEEGGGAVAGAFHALQQVDAEHDEAHASPAAMPMMSPAAAGRADGPRSRPVDPGWAVRSPWRERTRACPADLHAPRAAGPCGPGEYPGTVPVNVQGPQWTLVILPPAGSGRRAMAVGPAR